MRRRTGTLALAVVLAAAPVLGAVEGFHYTREVTVPAAGWVRVPLDTATLQHLAPGAADLAVFAPGGGQVPARLALSAPRSERRPVQAVEVESEEGGWVVVLDVGPAPVPHERLFFDFTRAAAVPAVRLESSPDGKAWRLLAEGDLFRIGPGDGLQQTALSYPPTEDRHLRLHWPAAAGLPRVSAVEVETVTGPSLTATQDAKCDRGRPGVAVCTLELPAPGQTLRRLTVEIEAEGAVGYRLDQPRDARWLTLAAGVWQRDGGRTRHLLPGAEEPVAGSLLRLELYGGGKAAPRLVSYGIELALPTIVFEAGEPGLYTLAYGGTVRGESRFGGEGPGAAWLEAGPEREHALPLLPTSATAPGARLRGRFTAGWRVVAPAARPGDLVRLELPDGVYAAARPDLGDLRVVVGERQIPFFRWSPPAPVAAVEKRGLQPLPLERVSDESQVQIHLPEAGLPVTGIDLAAPGIPLRRAVGVRYLEPVRPGARPRDRPAVARQTWECSPEPPLPCRARLPLPGPAPETLAVRFHDGDNAPLPDLEATVWRRGDVLLFVWPATTEERPVRLVAGQKTLGAPSYDLEALGDVLLGRPWQPAELDLGGEADPAAPWWSRWVLPVTLGIAGIFLLLLLRKILAES